MLGDGARLRRILALLPPGVYIDDDHPAAERARQAFREANRDRQPVTKRVFSGSPGIYYERTVGPGLLVAPRTAYRPKGEARPGPTTGGKPAVGPPAYIDPVGGVALILAVIAAPLGVILGVVSLARSAGGRYVLWPAITSIAVGTALTAAIVIGPLLLALALAPPHS